MVARLENINAVGTGFYVNFPQVDEQAKWFDWYEGKFRSLLTDPTINNGGKLYAEADFIDLPLFRMGSTFTKNATLAEAPAYTTQTDAGLDWIEENWSMLSWAMQRGTIDWSICRTAVFLGSADGLIREVNPLYYYRVGPPEYDDLFTSHVIIEPYRHFDLATQRIPPVYFSLPKFRVQVIKVTPEGSTVQHFEYSPSKFIGRAIGSAKALPPTIVCTAGYGDSWYPAVKTLAGYLMREASLRQADVNRHRNRIRYVPPGVVTDMQLAVERLFKERQQPIPDKGFTAAVSRAELEATVRPILPFGDPNLHLPEDQYLLDLSAVDNGFANNLNLFWMGAELPPSSYGIGVGKGESGYAREKAQDAASTSIREYRRELAICLGRLVVAAGCPDSKVTFNWVTPPFQDQAKTLEELVLMIDKGIIDPDEARTKLGFKPRTKTQGEQSYPQSVNNEEARDA